MAELGLLPSLLIQYPHPLILVPLKPPSWLQGVSCRDCCQGVFAIGERLVRRSLPPLTPFADFQQRLPHHNWPMTANVSSVFRKQHHALWRMIYRPMLVISLAVHGAVLAMRLPAEPPPPPEPEPSPSPTLSRITSLTPPAPKPKASPKPKPQPSLRVASPPEDRQSHQLRPNPSLAPLLPNPVLRQRRPQPPLNRSHRKLVLLRRWRSRKRVPLLKLRTNFWDNFSKALVRWMPLKDRALLIFYLNSRNNFLQQRAYRPARQQGKIPPP